MKLKVERNWLLGNTTLGRLYIKKNDVSPWKFFSYTLEDMVREKKVKGQTAIPYGSYPVDITYSPKFKRDMPIIQNVPNFDGIRIHRGFDINWTEGCLLVGYGVNETGNKLEKSEEAASDLYALLDDAKNQGKPITIDIVAPDKNKLLVMGLSSVILVGIAGYFWYTKIYKQ